MCVFLDVCVSRCECVSLDVCDVEISTMRRPRSNLGCFQQKEKLHPVVGGGREAAGGGGI